MALIVNITKRDRRRKLKDGSVVVHTRYVVQWRDPRTSDREQRFFELRREADEFRAKIVADHAKGAYVAHPTKMTVAEAVRALIDQRASQIRPNTLVSYREKMRYIVGPVFSREDRQRVIRAGKRLAIEDQPEPAYTGIGHLKVQDITTREIRLWHGRIVELVSLHAANAAKQFLNAALKLAAEDLDFRPPAMPTGLRRRTDRPRKMVLTPDQVGVVIARARESDTGIYVAFPFLTGVRVSEQLGLLWDDVDFEANRVHIRRTQIKETFDLVEVTKTEAGLRSIPMSSVLREMLLAWRVRCPRHEGKLYRVFPALGPRVAWPKPRQGGGPLPYGNFHTRIWKPFFVRNGLPPVSPHSARHSFISGLQTQGAEIGLAAQLAGHKNLIVTLGYYTHAQRDGADIVDALAKSLMARSSR